MRRMNRVTQALCIVLPMVVCVLGVASTAQATPLVINEIDYDDPGQDLSEFVEIKNISDAPVFLGGHYLRFFRGPYASIYQDITLFAVDLQPGEYFVVCGDSANTENCDQDISPDFGLIDNGAHAIALFKGSTIMDTVTYEGTFTGITDYIEGSGPAVADSSTTFRLSLSRTPDGGDSNDNANDFTLACSSPGAMNDSLATGCDPAEAALKVNEIDYDQGTVDAAEFVEIINASDGGIALAPYGLTLVDGANGLPYYTLPLPDRTLEAGGLLVICGDLEQVANCDVEMGTGVDLMLDTAAAAAVTFSERPVDTLSYVGTTAGFTEGEPAAADDGAQVSRSLSRYPDGADNFDNSSDFRITCSSPGSHNLAAAINCAAPATGLVINEIDYDQGSVDDAEFIEIANTSSATISLRQFYFMLIDGATGQPYGNSPLMLPNVDLAAGDFFVYCGRTANVADCDREAGVTDWLQDGRPDAVALFSPHNLLVDTVSYGGTTEAPYTEGTGAGVHDPGEAQADTTSISRTPGGTDNDNNAYDFKSRCSTPGATNSEFGGACGEPGICGNGYTDVNLSEGCDDGNVDDGDGCSSSCVLEAGFTCYGVAPTLCTADCGANFDTLAELSSWKMTPWSGAVFEAGESTFGRGPGVETALNGTLPAGVTQTWMSTPIAVPILSVAPASILAVDYRLEGDGTEDCMDIYVNTDGSLNGNVYSTCDNTGADLATVEIDLTPSAGYVRQIVIHFSTDDADNDYAGLFVNGVRLLSDLDEDGLFELASSSAAMAAAGCDPCVDVDGDGYGQTAGSADLSACSGGSGTDCNDDSTTGALINPGAMEIGGNGEDENCNGRDDCYEDLDGDGFGSSVLLDPIDGACTDTGEASTGGDCDDDVTSGAAVHPGATEQAADGIDQNCDGQELCFEDADGDTFGVPTVTISEDDDCADVGESVTDNDCDDVSDDAADRFIGNTELIGDGVDQDCDNVEDCYEDLDNDGVGSSVVIPDSDFDCDNDSKASSSITGDSDDANNTLCGDADADGCDDCASGTFDTAADGDDTDGDGMCDAGDDDDDGDTIADASDNCPMVANADQKDADGDGKGNACDNSNDEGCGCRAGNAKGASLWLLLFLVPWAWGRRRRMSHRVR